MNNEPTTYKSFEDAAAACRQLAGPDGEVYCDGMAVEAEEEGGWSFVPVDAGSLFIIERRDENGNEQGHHGTD